MPETSWSLLYLSQEDCVAAVGDKKRQVDSGKSPRNLQSVFARDGSA